MTVNVMYLVMTAGIKTVCALVQKEVFGVEINTVGIVEFENFAAA